MEERYFEMYNFGRSQSKKIISMEEFATRMVELDWVPTGFTKNNKFKILFRYRTMMYMNSEIIFKHKSIYNLQFTKKKSFLFLKEKDSWTIDLIQMIRSPFYSPSDS